jgi:hypothetical protein
MSQHDTIALREVRSSDVSEQHILDAEQDAINIEQAEIRQAESKRQRASVLLGNALLQLPIWGRSLINPLRAV